MTQAERSKTLDEFYDCREKLTVEILVTGGAGFIGRWMVKVVPLTGSLFTVIVPLWALIML